MKDFYDPKNHYTPVGVIKVLVKHANSDCFILIRMILLNTSNYTHEYRINSHLKITHTHPIVLDNARQVFPSVPVASDMLFFSFSPLSVHFMLAKLLYT